MERASVPARVQKAIDQAVHDGLLVGAVVHVAKNGELIFAGAAGYADREAGAPMREDAIFRYSSLTKPIVSAAAMALVELGSLRLDEPVVRWLPELASTLEMAAKELTVHSLLTHTAGFGYGFFEPADGPYRRAGVSDGLDRPGLKMDEQLRRLSEIGLLYSPGTNWRYSIAMDLLGEILARAASLDLASVVARYVTSPLGMRDTGFSVVDKTRLARPYVDGDGSPPRRMREPDVAPFGDGAGINLSPSRIFDPESFASGGAGMVGTARDFMTFLEAIRTGGRPIMTGSSATAMMSNQIGPLRIDVEPTPSWGFGYGGAVLIDRELAATPQNIGTWKWGGVYGHSWFVDPHEKLTVVALTNTAIGGMIGRFPSDIVAALYPV